MKRVLIIALGLLTAAAQADVRLPAIFSDGVVLQRDAQVAVWGTADAGEAVSVRINGQEQATKADGAGKWRVSLKSMQAGGPFEMTVAGKNTVTVKDILIGEVWICGGQSNMEWPLRSSSTADAEIPTAEDTQMRFFKIPHLAVDSEQADCEATWATSKPETRKDFSGVAYHFGKMLREELNVPVGLVQPTWGGTPAEAWMSDAALRQGDKFAGMFKRFETWKESAAADKESFDQQIKLYEAAAAEAKSKGEKGPRKPAQPKSTRPQLYPSKLYNGMIAPIAPMTARGVIWYQGEANAERANQYRTMLPALIEDWRRAFANDSLPFGIVQLANYGPTYTQPVEPSIWCELRDAQLQTARDVKNAGLVVAIDVGDPGNIHPKNKVEVGRRLSLWALAKVYGKQLEYSGPIVRRHEVKGDAIRIEFDHADGLKSSDGKLKGFAIAGADQMFVAADATIEGNAVVVRAPSVKQPASVRYAWMKNPICNLVNAAGLPASPFKTDKWPDRTTGEE